MTYEERKKAEKMIRELETGLQELKDKLHVEKTDYVFAVTYKIMVTDYEASDALERIHEAIKNGTTFGATPSIELIKE